MRGTTRVSLAASTYTLSPAEPMRNWGMDPLEAALSGREPEDYHLYDLRSPAGETVLEVVQPIGDEVVGEGMLDHATNEARLEFRDGGAEPALALERDGWARGALARPTYRLREPEGDVTLAAVDRDFPALWNWRLRTPSGDPAATVTKPWSARLRNAISLSTHDTYVVRSTDGADIATLERGMAAGGVPDMFLSELEITLSPSSIPPEAIVGIGTALLYEGLITD